MALSRKQLGFLFANVFKKEAKRAGQRARKEKQASTFKIPKVRIPKKIGRMMKGQYKYFRKG